MNEYNEKEKYKFDLRVWKKLLPFAAAHKKSLMIALFANVFCALIDIALPLFQKFAITNFIEKGTKNGLVPFALIYTAVVVFQGVSVLFILRRCMEVDVNIGRDLKRACFVHLQKLSLSYYNSRPVGWLLARVMSDTERIGQIVGWNLADICWQVIYIIGVFIAMFFLHPQLTLWVFLVVPIIAILTVFFQKKILYWNRQVRRTNSELSGTYNEGIVGAKTSKTLVIEDLNDKAFQNLSSRMFMSATRAARLNALFGPVVLFASTAAVAIVLQKGGNMTLLGELDISTLSAFITYALGIFGPIQQMVRTLANVISVQANVERVVELLEEKPLIEDSPEVIEKYGDAFFPKKENWENLRGDITFEDISFQYPDGDEEVLSHFNLHVPAGMTVAIVGETGAGKSTLVNLACRFFEPTGGRILIDGTDYKERSQLWLHSNIGYVLQNPHLFSGSVMDNIRYGRLDATDEEVYAAARTVSADKAVNKLEKGYENDVGEGGDHLSTGEKQLISFARAVLADPKIFVLDEATSSIDTHTEQLIQEATSTLLKGRTSFVIAHRLSTIRQADLILVVKDGKIIEQGTHDELLQIEGYYHTLFTKQFQEEAELTAR